jgi:peptidyl-tRNA hydrolase, PTH1 family
VTTLRNLFSRSSESPQRYLIVGLGNPGREYRSSRHNAGFMVVDRMASRLDVAFSRLESRALVTKAQYQDQPLILAKPQTFMNLSGQAVASLVRFYKIDPASRLLVIYDEVDLPLGTLRLRPAGGSAGHKGMSSIIERLNTQDFTRLRVGIGHPPGRKEAASHVLEDFSRAEVELLPEVLDRASDATLSFISEGIESAMNRFNGLE